MTLATIILVHTGVQSLVTLVGTTGSPSGL